MYFTVPLFADTSQPQTDELALLDEDDSIDPDDPEDETQEMNIPAGFRIQESKPDVLDRLLLQRGVFVRLGMGWFGGLIIQQSQQRTRHLYDYCVQLELDQSTRKMKLPLDKYRGDPDAAVGSWVLLKALVEREGYTPPTSRFWTKKVDSCPMGGCFLAPNSSTSVLMPAECS